MSAFYTTLVLYYIFNFCLIKISLPLGPWTKTTKTTTATVPWFGRQKPEYLAMHTWFLKDPLNLSIYYFLPGKEQYQGIETLKEIFLFEIVSIFFAQAITKKHCLIKIRCASPIIWPWFFQNRYFLRCKFPGNPVLQRHGNSNRGDSRR